MPSLDSCVRTLVEWLDRERVPHMVIGGVAVLAWGIERATFDVDISVWAPEREAALAESLAAAFRSRAEDPAAFVRRTAVLPLDVQGTRADIVFARLPYEERAIARARMLERAGMGLRVCAPEDLIVHKIVSERGKDLEDIRALIGLKKGELDRGYLDPIIRGLAQDLAKPEIWRFYASCITASA